MKRLWCIPLVFSMVCSAGAQTTGEQILRLGMYREDVEGHPKDAMALYEKVLSRFPNDRRCAAAAQVRKGSCQEKLGLLQGAIQSYQVVITKYPEQTDAAKIARSRLSVLSGTNELLGKEERGALINYYIKNVYKDLMSDLTSDGAKLAYTDWTTGNLVVKDTRSGKKTPLTHKTWEESGDFACWKAWSRDGKKIAYSWYRGTDSTQLRIMSSEGGKPQILFGQPGLMLEPKDWTPDGQNIIAKLSPLIEIDSLTGKPARMVSISTSTGNIETLYAVHGQARGTRVSHDGRFILFGEQDDYSAISGLVYSFSFKDRSKVQLPDLGHPDSPLWSPDGRFALVRVATGQGPNLGVIKMQEGKPVGRAIVINTNLAELVRQRAGVTDEQYGAYMQKADKVLSSGEKTAVTSFLEEFDSAVLDTAWKTVSWTGQNVYGFESCGRYSLTSRPGSLRYIADPMIVPGGSPIVSNLYGFWYYPALELCRVFRGNRWRLDVKVTFRLVPPMVGGSSNISIFFNPRADKSALFIFHTSGRTVSLSQSGSQSFDLHEQITYGENGDRTVTTWMRVSRIDSTVMVETSNDGMKYRQALQRTMSSDFFGSFHELVLSGGSWFIPGGCYADWDYVRLTSLEGEK